MTIESHKEARKYLFRRAVEDWRLLNGRGRLWGMWVAFHPPIDRSIDQIDIFKPALRVWFITHRGITEKGIWDIVRLGTVHFKQPWCTGFWKAGSGWWSKNEDNIGFVAFAQYEDSSDYYYDIMWGGLAGRGYRIKFDDEGNHIEDEGLWVS